MANDDRHILSTAQVAETLGVTTVTVLRWARAGRLEYQRLPGQTGAYLFDADSVAALKAGADA